MLASSSPAAMQPTFISSQSGYSRANAALPPFPGSEGSGTCNVFIGVLSVFFTNLPCECIGFDVWLGVLLRRESTKGCWSFGCLHLDDLPFVYNMHCAIIRRHLHQACWHIRISKSSAWCKVHACVQYRYISKVCNGA